MEVCINDLIIACNLELSPIARYILFLHDRAIVVHLFYCFLLHIPCCSLKLLYIAGSTSVVGCESSRGALKMLVALSEKLSIGYSLTSRVGLTFGGGLLIGLSLSLFTYPRFLLCTALLRMFVCTYVCISNVCMYCTYMQDM